MSDQDGATLVAGDPVGWRPADAEGGSDVFLSATVLAELAGNRYVIQLDGWQAGEGIGDLGSLGNQLLLIQVMRFGPPGDQQDAFEVDGSTLTFMGEWGE